MAKTRNPFSLFGITKVTINSQLTNRGGFLVLLYIIKNPCSSLLFSQLFTKIHIEIKFLFRQVFGH